MILPPFNYCLSTLVKNEYEQEIKVLRNGNTYHLNPCPSTSEEAFGACCSYLQGTASRERELLENKIKSEKDFRGLGVKDFRSKVAREYRDQRLSGKGTAFLHQAFRFRGKANYRDAIFLSYGQNMEEGIAKLIKGLCDSLACFVKMSCYYSQRRVEQGIWDTFYNDVTKYSLLKQECDILKIE